jgi:hypothetical protein
MERAELTSDKIYYVNFAKLVSPASTFHFHLVGAIKVFHEFSVF